MSKYLIMDGSAEESLVKVLFFAKARELSGLKECQIALPRQISYADLADRVIRKFKLESIRNNLIFAVNEEFALPDVKFELFENDEIAVIPPLSGEMSKDIVKLQNEKLNIGEIVDLVVSPNCGAVSTFSGTTRDSFEDKNVVKLEYEAYEPMALKEMKNVCGKIRSQWNVERIAIFHRLGEVPVSEVSVIIAISSPHRQESLQAVQYAIDTLKASVPIWKKEIYDTEKSQWKENKECSWSTNDANTIAVEAVHVVRSKTEDSCTDKKYILEEESKEITIDPNLVQIRANPEELNRRIESFIARKRQQVNIVNVQEFCCHRDQTGEKEGSCARVDAILIRRKDSKSHMKVHRVLNPWGPQTMDPSTLYKTSTLPNRFPNMKETYSSGLEERLSTSEKLLGMNGPVPRDVYERLKNIEDRILHLESISPEYKDFWVTEESESLRSTYKPIRKRTFSTAELDTKLHELEDRYVKKIK